MTQQTGLNPTQIYLLGLFNYNQTVEELSNLKKALTKFYAKRLNQRKSELYKEGILSEEKLYEFVSHHNRTSYK